jgi:NAD(P)-dependent dehydrogenase (short-subunit alcohol dehydrogenase family)
METLRAEVTDRLGVVTVLMNNAGIGPTGRALNDIEVWQRLMAVNLWASFTARRSSRRQ